MNQNKNIAVLVSSIDEKYQNLIIKGIRDYAKKINYNVSVFIAFGGMIDSKEYDIGEYNIYNLIDTDKFDGAILLTNTVSSAGIVASIIRKLKEKNIPIVSIDNDFEDMYYIGVDNYKGMELILEHFIKVHKKTRINYISGAYENSESMERYSAYKHVLARYDIPVEEERVYIGSFNSRDGSNAVKKFLDSGLPEPEVIVAANDTMALAAVIELENKGKRVPEDILVSGFDNIYEAKNYSPSITSVKRPLYKSGFIACQKIYNHIENKNPQRVEMLDISPVFLESCGCSKNKLSIEDVKTYKKINSRLIENYEIAIPFLADMNAELTACSDINAFLITLKKYVLDIHCDKFYLCLCDNWMGDIDNGSLINNNYLKNGYTEKMYMPIVFENNKFYKTCSFKSKDVLPDLFKLENDKSNIYYFSPIHHNDRCFGYLVICGSNFPLSNPLYNSLVMGIGNGLEHIRKMTCLNNLVQELDMLSIFDPLTNIYNRNGFMRFARNILHKGEKHKPVVLMFIDMDGLKYINDTYGHQEGDIAIVTLANTLKEVCTNGEVFSRYGGDEFIVLAQNYKKIDAEKLKSKIEKSLLKYNFSSDKEYNVEASIGYFITYFKEDTSIYDLISLADKKMYENKKIKHQEKTIT